MAAKVGSWLGHIPIRDKEEAHFELRGQIVHAFREHAAAIRSVSISNEHYIVTGSKDNTVKLWSLDEANSQVTSTLSHL